MIKRIQILLDPGLYAYLARRLINGPRQLVRDYLHHRSFPKDRLAVAPDAKVGQRVAFTIESGLEKSDPARIEIGECAYIEDGAELGLIPGARMTVGRNTSIHRGCVILGNVRIGANCIFSYNIYVATGTHVVREHPTWLIKDQDDAFAMARLSETVWIDDDVWIGWGAFVRNGAHVGRGAVIGANAVVTSDVEPYAIYAGIPARKIGQRIDFAPPAELNAKTDSCLPYFYSGFLDDQVSLGKSRALGAIRLAGASRIVLSAATDGAVRVRGLVEEGARRVDMRISVNGKQVAGEQLGAGPFELIVRLQPSEADSLPPLLRAYTVLDLDAGPDAFRVAVQSAGLIKSG